MNSPIIIGADLGLVGDELRLERKVYLKILDGVIARVYTDRVMNADKYYEECIIVPGFINMHTHVADAIAKERAYGLELKEVVAPPDGLKHKILSSTPENVLRTGIITTLKEMISRGIATFVDFREGGVEGAKLLRDVSRQFGINAIIMGRPDGSPVDRLLSVADGLGLSSLNRFSDEELITLREFARKHKKLIAYHASETPKQREKSVRKYGINDVIRGIKLLQPDFIVHLTYIDEHDAQIIRDSGTLIVLCPRANGYFGLGPPPIELFYKIGINFCIGTDNVMVNSPDIFREFDYIIRIGRIQGVVIPPQKLLESVTVLPARHLGLKTGIIHKGYSADFFIFDLTRPNVSFVEDPIKAIVMRGTEANIVATYIHGRMLYGM